MILKLIPNYTYSKLSDIFLLQTLGIYFFRSVSMGNNSNQKLIDLKISIA